MRDTVRVFPEGLLDCVERQAGVGEPPDSACVYLFAGRCADDAKPGSAHSDLGIGAARLSENIPRPGVDLAGFGIAAMIEIDRGDFGAGQRKADTVRLAVTHSLRRGGV